MKNKHLYILCSILLLMSACSLKTKADSDTIIKESSIKLNRFDKEFDKYLSVNMTDRGILWQNLSDKNKDFLAALGIVAINKKSTDKDFESILNIYFSNETLRKIYTDAIIKFDDVTTYETELSNADLRINKYFKGKKLPQLGMHVSGFKENTIVLSDYISISIDKYLGSDYPMYVDFFEDYRRTQMQPKMITRDILRAWIVSEQKSSKKKKDLLEEIISEGKVLYTLSALLPEWNKCDLIGYSATEWDWSKENEVNIWNTIVKKNFLYNKDYLLIEKFMTEAPHTYPISAESPGRLGAWLGWQIVDKYMSETNLPLQDLINKEVSVILKESKYEPK